MSLSISFYHVLLSIELTSMPVCDCGERQTPSIVKLKARTAIRENRLVFARLEKSISTVALQIKCS